VSQLAWTQFSLHFRQLYEGGYRYLDRCGQFIFTAESELGFIPLETLPTGAKLEIPEDGITAEVDSNEIRILQELPTDGGERFASNCLELTTWANTIFEPRRISRNGIASKWVIPFATEEAAQEATLVLTEGLNPKLAELTNMIPSSVGFSQTFTSGSLEMIVAINVGAYHFTKRSQTYSHRDSPEKRNNVLRQNMRVNRILGDFNHVLAIDIDLMEYDPPDSAVQSHFAEFKSREVALLDYFRLLTSRK
jgi:hypothetical protein